MVKNIMRQPCFTAEKQQAHSNEACASPLWVMRKHRLSTKET
ncbi:hypothetical protein [Bacteroides timonensis]|nr:hypothetical protein [Bacteroides timonensis]